MFLTSYEAADVTNKKSINPSSPCIAVGRYYLQISTELRCSDDKTFSRSPVTLGVLAHVATVLFDFLNETFEFARFLMRKSLS